MKSSESKLKENNCLIKYFKLEDDVNNLDCEKCPFKNVEEALRKKRSKRGETKEIKDNDQNHNQ